jgi:hypothetical protein
LLKGYKDGWAFIKYVEKFNEKPPWAWRHHQPMQAGPEVLQYIRSGFISWARSKSNPNNRPMEK